MNPAHLLALKTRHLTADRAEFLAGTITANEAREGLNGIGWGRYFAVHRATEAGLLQATDYLEALAAFDAAAAALALALEP